MRKRRTWGRNWRRSGAIEAEKRKAATDALRSRIEKALPLLWENREHRNPEVRNGVKELLRHAWRRDAVDAYRKAFASARANDLKKKILGPRS